MAPFSTKYLVFRSSIPPVVRITFAPDARIFSTRSFVISASRCLIAKLERLLSMIFFILVLTLEFFWIVNNNVNTHLHFSFLKWEIKTCNFGSCNFLWHLLRCNCTVESITIYKLSLFCATAICLENIDGFDWITLNTLEKFFSICKNYKFGTYLWISKLDQVSGIDNKISEKFGVHIDNFWAHWSLNENIIFQ